MNMLSLIYILSALLVAAIACIAWLAASRPSGNKMRERDEERFRLLANEVLAANSRQLRADNETKMNEILKPLHQNLADFQRSFVEMQNRNARQNGSLQENIRQLIQLNDNIGRETRELSAALRGNNRMQGQWGELILRNILEKSGLRPGQDFCLQSSITDDNGNRLRPDATIQFPDGRVLVIDSKASLTSYMEMVQCTDESRCKVLERQHALSIKNHINELRDKKYQDYVGCARIDFVMMFIPNEGAYLAALNADSTLWEYAYDQRVIIVSPTHLMSVVKLVEQSWRQDLQNRNAEQIALEGGRLIDKLAGFLQDMQRVETSLGNAQKAYDNALTKLKGQGGLISKAEKLRQLGAKSNKPLPYTEPLSDQ